MSKQSLDLIVGQFRREVSGQAAAQWAAPGRNLELEIRIQDVGAANFATIYSTLLAGKTPDGRILSVGEPVLSQTLGILMPASWSNTKPAGIHHPSIIREIKYEKGEKVSDKFNRKEPLAIPWHSPRSSGLAYTVALAAESPSDHSVSANENAMIRIKARVSFPIEIQATNNDSGLTEKLHWRIDLSIIREISGAEASTKANTISDIVTQMFKTSPPMTAKTLLQSLGIERPNGASAAIAKSVSTLYRYEVEIEFVEPAASRDALRAADINAAAELVLSLASPERVRDAALQAAIYRAAKFIVRGSPGELRAYESERGLRQLLPQARALTRSDYREIFPPRGLYLTDKADGKRALGLVRDGRGIIVADELHDNFTPLASSEPRNPMIGASGSVGDTIMDGELVFKDGQMHFYVFDAIIVNGNDLSQSGFETRILSIAEGVLVLQAAGIPASSKLYTHLVSAAPADLERAIRGVHDAKRPYSVDGLIFVAPGHRYSDTPNYKWKSTRDNTIDFLVRRAPASVLGRAPFIDKPGHKLYYLFTGVTSAMYNSLGMQRCPGYADLFTETSGYFPIQFAPSDIPLAYLYDHPNDPAANLASANSAVANSAVANSALANSAVANSAANSAVANLASADPDNGEIDGHIVEMRCAGNCLAAGGGAARVDWEIVRLRDDRKRDLNRSAYFGNDFRIAELTWLNYVDVFPLSELWTGPTADYFQTPRAGVYRAQTAVTNFVKTRLIEELQRAAWVVDIGAGRGSDLGRYFSAEVGHLIAVDKDRAALAELVRRRYEFARRGVQPIGASTASAASALGVGPRQRGRGTMVHIVAADAGEPYAKLRLRFVPLGLAPDGADALVCNLAVHYFMGSTESMKNFAAFARETVRSGGRLMLTVLAGDKVHAAFKTDAVAPGKSWDRLEAPAYAARSGKDRADKGNPETSDAAIAVRKYSLQRLYASDSLEATGQRIGVLLPFSDGRYYEEFLVNIDVLSKALSVRGFGAPVRRSVADSIPEFTEQNRPLAAELTDADKEWLSMYATLVYKRNK